jgi:hypothetical protein
MPGGRESAVIEGVAPDREVVDALAEAAANASRARVDTRVAVMNRFLAGKGAPARATADAAAESPRN